MKDGKEVRTSRGVVAKDGKSLSVIVKVNDANGTPIAGTLVLDKQPGS